MKNKILIFIGIITLTLSFLLVAPKTKALTLYDDYNAMVVGWEGNDEVYITLFNEGDTFTDFVDIHNILDNTGTEPILFGYENKVGIKLKLSLISTTPRVYHGKIVEVVEQLDINVFNIEAMIPNQNYEYKGIYDNYYIFQQGLNFYRVEIGTVNFKNDIDAEYSFTTVLKPGNVYTYITDFGLDDFFFADSYDYRYSIGYQRGREVGEATADRAFSDGYEAGIKYAEGLLVSEYQRGYQNGSETGYTEGYDDGFIDGFNDAYNEIISSDEYTLGYENGFKAGEKSQLSKNTETFYNGIEKWLVPAIITVIVLGGIMSISALKRREQ